MKVDQLVGYCHLTPERDVVLYLSDSTFHVKSIHGDFSFSHKKRFNRLFSIFNHDNKVWVTTDKGRFVVDFVHKDFSGLPAMMDYPIQPLLTLSLTKKVIYTSAL